MQMDSASMPQLNFLRNGMNKTGRNLLGFEQTDAVFVQLI